MQTYQLLDWDTEVFNFRVGKILPERLDEPALAVALQALKHDGVKLVYWAADSADTISQSAAQQHHGLLVDRKITYLKSLTPAITSVSGQNIVEEYTATKADAELEFLALQSGLYSRFKVDPKIPEAIFAKLYKTWIANSVRKQIAYKVLVVRREGRLAGMITLGEKNGRGDLGLLATHPDFRGLKIASDLIHVAQAEFIEQGYAQTQVVTQAENKPACALYEKCSYTVAKIENFYHFWLG